MTNLRLNTIKVFRRKASETTLGRSICCAPTESFVRSSLAAHDCEAITAVHGPIGFGLEGNASFLAAASADSSEILTGTTSGILAGIAAGLAALRLVLEAALCIELLLTGGKHELLPTFLANQRLVLIHR